MLQSAYSLDSNLQGKGSMGENLVPAPYILLKEAGKSGKRNIRSDSTIREWDSGGLGS